MTIRKITSINLGYLCFFDSDSFNFTGGLIKSSFETPKKSASLFIISLSLGKATPFSHFDKFWRV